MWRGLLRKSAIYFAFAYQYVAYRLCSTRESSYVRCNCSCNCRPWYYHGKGEDRTICTGLGPQPSTRTELAVDASGTRPNDMTARARIAAGRSGRDPMEEGREPGKNPTRTRQGPGMEPDHPKPVSKSTMCLEGKRRTSPPVAGQSPARKESN